MTTMAEKCFQVGHGKLTPEQEKVIHEMIAAHESDFFHVATYNYWVVYAWPDGTYTVMRDSWGGGYPSEPWEETLARLQGYLARED